MIQVRLVKDAPSVKRIVPFPTSMRFVVEEMDAAPFSTNSLAAESGRQQKLTGFTMVPVNGMESTGGLPVMVSEPR